MTVEKLGFTNLAGEVFDSIGVYQQVLISSTLQNNENEALSYVLIIDIRNEDDYSVDIIFHEGDIGPQETTTVQTSWRPEKVGKFSVREFVIRSLTTPEILSLVRSTPADVSEESIIVLVAEEIETLPAPVEPTEADAGPAAYSILVYMVASDLESERYAATTDITEMMEAGITSDINVIVQTGGSANSTLDDNRFIDFTIVQRHEIRDNDIKTVMDLGQKNMGDSRTLQDFITWSISEYPAEKYAIILWDHGNGLRGFGKDDIFNDHLTIRELTDAFSQAKKNTQVQFEFIGFDACLMATYEVAWRVSPYGHYLISSEEVVPEWGWDYNTVLSSLGNAGPVDGQTVGKIIADSYMVHSKANADSYQDYDADRWITLSVIDLSKMEEVREEVKDLGNAIYKHLTKLEQAQTLAKTLQYTERYGLDYDGSAGYSDLYQLVENMGQSFPEYKSLANIVQDRIEKAIVYNVHGEAKPNAHGMSIFLQLDEYQSGEEHLFYLDSEWLGVIENGAKELAADEDAPTGWVDYSSGDLEGQSYDEDVSYGFLSFYKESEGSKYELVAYFYLEPSRFLQTDHSIQYELKEGILSLCNDDDCAPAFVYLVDNGDSQFAYFPVRLESGEYDERVTLIYEINRGDFIFIGAWEGVENGTAQRGFRPLQDGDRIFTYTFEYDTEDQDYSSELESEPIEVTDDFSPDYIEYEEEYTFDMAFCDYAENCAYSTVFEL